MMSFIRILLSCICYLAMAGISVAQSGKRIADVKQTMLEATKFMVEEVSTNGGYVGLYLPDFSRRWGELEAYKTMIWVQSPGTVDMGNLFLNAYDITADEYYYKAAEKVANALAWGQHDTGGWNYMIDFAGDASLKKWYATIGKNAWGFEEHNHYYGNATFDDEVTSGAAKFLLRVYLEKMDKTFRPALDKVIDFMLRSQYPLGGWPQRYPLMYDFPHGNLSDYTSFYTYNDDVILGNLNFLIACYVTLGEERFIDPIRRAMNFYLISQEGNPQGGWGQQYDMKIESAHARTYEPPALLPTQTFNNAMSLITFYKYTGDRRFLSRIPDAIHWLESTRLPNGETENGKYTHPVFVERGTNKAIYAHRQGSGVSDGHYWWDYKDENPLLHYGSKTKINIEQLKQAYDSITNISSEQATKDSPLKAEQSINGLPQRYFAAEGTLSDKAPDESTVKTIIDALDSQHRWLTKHEWGSRPYSILATGEETNTARYSDQNGRAIRDSSDQAYISIKEYIKNMSVLINYVKAHK